MEKLEKEYGLRHLFLGLVAIFSLILLLVVVFSDNSDRSNTSIQQQTQLLKQNEALDEFGAYLQGQYYIKQALVSPATAKFPPLDFIVHRLNDDRYEVVSYVDSQNSFGALLRSSWNVVFKYQGGKTYLERMTVNGKVVYPIKESDDYKRQQEIQKETQKLLEQIESEQEKLKSWGY